MRTSTAIARSAARSRRRRRIARTAESLRVLDGRRSGRAWINGREIGGVDARFAHLGRSYD